MKHSFLLKLAACITIVFFTGNVNAQLVNCNIFMQGNYLELGINNNGAFGTSVNAPTGYHANVYDTMYNPCTLSFSVPQGLGFVADPSKTGWSTYYGDFIMPHNPHEGWGISDNSGTGYAYASYYHITGASGYSGPLTGANTSYSSSGSTKVGVWAGSLTTDTLSIVQTTTIDTANLYLLQHIRFYNLGSSVIDSFFYLRTVNAHSDETISGNFNTLNKIEYQLPNVSNLTVVSASGTVDTTAYIALGTKDLRARGFIIRHAALPPSGTFASIYYGDTANYRYTVSDTLTEDGGIGLIFRIGGMGPGDSITIDYGYSFKGGILDTVLHVDTVAHGPLQNINVNKPNNIVIYPNPAKDIINISGLDEGNYISVYDVFGRNILQKEITGTQSVNTISISNLPSGVYILAIKDTNGNVRLRSMVRKM